MVHLNNYILEKLHINRKYKDTIEVNDLESFVNYLEAGGAKLIYDEDDSRYIVCDENSDTPVNFPKRLSKLNITYPYFFFTDLEESSKTLRRKINDSNVIGFTMEGVSPEHVFPGYVIHDVDSDGDTHNTVVLIKNVGLDYDEVDNKIVFKYNEKNAGILLKYLINETDK